MTLSQPRQLLTDEERVTHRRETQQRYVHNKKEELISYRNENTSLRAQLQILSNQLIEKDLSRSQLQSQLNEKTASITLLQQLLTEKDVLRTSLQSQIRDLDNTILQLRQQLSDRHPSLSDLQQQLTEKDSNIAQLQSLVNQNESSISQLQQQLSQKDISVSQLQQQVNECTERNTFMLHTISEKDISLSQLRTQLTEKDTTISQLQTRLNNCVSTDVDRRLQDMSQSLANEMERQKSCLQTINQLNSENSNLKIFRDLAIELNNKFPKVLSSFVNEIQQPGNLASSPELNAWARDQITKISPTLILSLAPFKSPTPTQVPLQPNAPVRSPSPIIVPTTNQPVATQPITQPIIQPLISTQPLISSQNVPFVSLLPNTSTSNIPESRSSMNTPIFNHPASNDPDFHRWFYLYRNNLKDGNEYINLYQVLRRRYNMTPIQITKQYNLR